MDVTGIVDQFRRAAFGMDDWQDGLRSVATATGAQVVHLSGLDPTGAPMVNLIHGVTLDMLDLFVRHGGFDPRRNPRAGVGGKWPSLRTVVDEDIVTERDRDVLPIYSDLFVPAGAGRAAMNRLDIPQIRGLLAVMRPRSYADGGCMERRLLEAVTPAISEIVMQAMQLGGQQDQMIRSTAEALERSVLLLDRTRRIVLMSQSIEHWFEQGGPLTVRGGEVLARDPASEAALATAIASARDPARSLRPGRKVVLRMAAPHLAGGVERLIVTVSAVPQRPSGPLGRAQVMISGKRVAEPSADVYSELFDLTRAEAHIAVLLAQGHKLAAIAALRGCSVLTVRTQLRTIFEKTDTNSQSALVTRLHAVD